MVEKQATTNLRCDIPESDTIQFKTLLALDGNQSALEMID
jgi:hypothetical protein